MQTTRRIASRQRECSVKRRERAGEGESLLSPVTSKMGIIDATPLTSVCSRQESVPDTDGRNAARRSFPDAVRGSGCATTRISLGTL